MIPDLDWSNPAVVKRYRRKIIRRSILQFALLPFLIGLLPVAGFTLYRRFYPEKAEQQRQRVREYINTQLDSPAAPIRVRSVVPLLTTILESGVLGAQSRRDRLSCGL